MNENHIRLTMELCPEDRARLDKIIGLLEARCTQTQFVLEQEYDGQKQEDEKPTSEVDEALRKVLNGEKKLVITKLKEGDPGYCPHNDEATEAPKTAQDEPKASDHPTLDPFPEQPTEAEDASEESVQAVTTSELQQLVIALCRAGKKDKVREVISTYDVQTVAAIPEDKLAEVFRKLKMLGA